MSDTSFGGARIVTFESRMADSTARLVEKWDGIPISAPSMQEVPLEEHEDVYQFGEALFDGQIGAIVLLTGVGTRMMVDVLETRYAREDIIDHLDQCLLIARGPKPVRALKKMGLSADYTVPEPNTTEELIELLQEADLDLPELRIAVQEYGRPNDTLVDFLSEKGADVVRVPIYRWTLPDDLEPLKNGIQTIIAGDAQAAAFTSRHQISNVLQVARQEGMEEDLREAFKTITVASIGPVCTSGLQEHDITVDFEPDRPKLAIFLKGLANNL